VKSTSKARVFFSTAIRAFTEFPRACRGRTVSGMSIIHRIPHREIVARVIAYLRENLGETVSVAQLSHIAGVSERTLRAAFHDVVGISPKQHIIRERLRAARAALRAAAPGTTTVTDIAMSYGFYELGRFAGRYRHTFGEMPSWTLRHEETAKVA
jgi:transcriptional regulator GlxA family with amidase domain